MNVLFLNLTKIKSFEDDGLYTCLMREFIKKGFNVFSVSTVERREKTKTKHIIENNNHLLLVKTFNLQKTNFIEKAIGFFCLKHSFISAIKKHFKGVKFDLIIYSTPPIHFYDIVAYYKKRHKSKTYLLLRDIFPQNVIDLGLLSSKGLKGTLLSHYKKKEKKLYTISDKIGCMSPANVEYLLSHYSYLNKYDVEVFPNCIDPERLLFPKKNIFETRKKFGLPTNKKVFVYGGNLGKPQAVPFIIDCIKALTNQKDIFFLIIGGGTDYKLLEEFIVKEKPDNFKLISSLPRNQYEEMVQICDVGLIFLDYRFTIPNYPSRILSYMKYQLPVLACTDLSSDIGKTITDGGFGWWCPSNSVEHFKKTILEIDYSCFDKMKENEHTFLIDNFSSNKACQKFFNFIDFNFSKKENL